MKAKLNRKIRLLHEYGITSYIWLNYKALIKLKSFTSAAAEDNPEQTRKPLSLSHMKEFFSVLLSFLCFAIVALAAEKLFNHFNQFG